MKNIKQVVLSLLNNLPDNCTLENIQYHLYVIEKVNRGIQRASSEGRVSQQAVEKRLFRGIE